MVDGRAYLLTLFVVMYCAAISYSTLDAVGVLNEILFPQLPLDMGEDDGDEDWAGENDDGDGDDLDPVIVIEVFSHLG
jgi:hypothetical protein